jgi:murein DD-endopeptidase MepM/ murein hydrolase activator NlpD
MRSSLRLGIVLTLLVGINVYVFFFRGGTSIQDVKKAVKEAQIPAEQTPGTAASLAPAPSAKPADEPTGPAAGKTVEGKIQKGDSLLKILEKAGVETPEANEVVEALKPVMDFKTIREGQAYFLRFDDDGQVIGFELRASPVLLYRVERGQDGKLVGKKSEAKTEIRVLEVHGEITSSLYEAVKSRGEATELVGILVELFAYDINFYIDTHPGDRFKIVVEKIFLGDEFYKYGRVLAAEYAGDVGTYRAFWWAPPGEKGAYYTETGNNVAKAFLKTPVKFVRVSSKFNPRRMHPVFHTVRGHFGTDFAAPQGTPIWAAADGKVTSVGRRGGAGNAVTLDHGGGLTTIYMHMSRYAKGLRVGQRISQKQVIGFVGMTGWATGPHLHFGVKKNGKYVDFQRMKIRREAPIPPAKMAEFKNAIGPQLAVLEKMGTMVTAKTDGSSTQ